MAVRLQAGICQAPKRAAQTTCWVSHCYKATVSLVDVRHCWWPMAWNYKMSSVCQVNLQMWMFVLLSLLLHPVGEHCHLWACQHQHCKIVNRNQQGKNICCHQAIQCRKAWDVLGHVPLKTTPASRHWIAWQRALSPLKFACTSTPKEWMGKDHMLLLSGSMQRSLNCFGSLCLWEHFQPLYFKLLEGGRCSCLFIPLWAGWWLRQVNFGTHRLATQFEKTSGFSNALLRRPICTSSCYGRNKYQSWNSIRLSMQTDKYFGLDSAE